MKKKIIIVVLVFLFINILVLSLIIINKNQKKGFDTSKYVCTYNTYNANDLSIDSSYIYDVKNNKIIDYKIESRYYIKTDAQYKNLINDIKDCKDDYKNNKMLICDVKISKKSKDIIGKDIKEYIAIQIENNFNCILKED